MVTQTTNLKLKKPDYGESADISVINGNMDTLDTAVNGKAPTSHASSGTTYGVSTASAYGHAMASSTTPKANGTASVGSETAKFARGDHVHPAQTTVSGNAGSATKLQTARTIDGMSFNGTANIIHYAECSTEASTKDKVVALSGFTLATGAQIIVKFTNGNTFVPSTSAGAITLNVNSTGAKNIQAGGSDIDRWEIGTKMTVGFVYDGTYWVVIKDRDNNTGNSTGATNLASTKLFLTGAKSQTDWQQTFSNASVYIGTDNKVYSNGTVVVDGAGTGLSKSGSTLGLASVTQSDGTDTASPSHGGTFTAISAVTRDGYGRVTGVTTKTVTLPTDNNTDTKVTQANSTASTAYPILLKNGTGTGTITSTAIFNSGVTVTPSTGTVTATTFSGALSGNATTATSATSATSATKATQLANARAIDGVSFNGTSAIIHYGTCSTTASTITKVVSVSGFTLVTGARVTVKFTVTNTASEPMLNVNGTGQRSIMYRGSKIPASYLASGRTYEFVYDGTNYELVGDIDTNTTSTTSTGTSNKTGTKLFLVGAPIQGDSETTYTNTNAYVGTDNQLYSAVGMWAPKLETQGQITAGSNVVASSWIALVNGFYTYASTSEYWPDSNIGFQGSDGAPVARMQPYIGTSANGNSLFLFVKNKSGTEVNFQFASNGAMYIGGSQALTKATNLADVGMDEYTVGTIYTNSSGASQLVVVRNRDNQNLLGYVRETSTSSWICVAQLWDNNNGNGVGTIPIIVPAGWQYIIRSNSNRDDDSTPRRRMTASFKGV